MLKLGPPLNHTTFQAMDNPETNDQSVLLMFDPLTSPLKSGITRETPRRRRDLDPTSPVAAFFSSVDKSKSLLATVRKQKQADLIELGQVQSPLRAIHEHVEQATGETTASVMATPLPTFRVTMEDTKGPPIDPFSPATYATTSSIQFFPPTHQLNLRRDPSERNNLVFLETPAKTDLLMSTNFTPVPANLPSLLNASLSSLRHSGTDSVTSTGRRRRSSIDLDQELQAKSPDSSFDILRGELEIGNSADVSFVSVAAVEDYLRASGNAAGDGVGESPWTIRTTAPSGYQLGSGLLPVEEVRETSLLAHEIPLPDSCPTSPESSTGHNEDANIHASKVFSHLRRFSMANPSNGNLQFPTEEPSPPRSPGKKILYNINTSRKPVVHARTTSMSSISSISSSRSGVTLKGSPSKRVGAAQGTPKSPSKMAKMTATPTSPTKITTGGLGSAKRLPRPSIAAAKPQTSASAAAKPRMSVMPAPRASLAPARKTVNVVGAGAPRASIVTRPRASMAPPSTGGVVPSSMANGAGAVKRAPRASVQPAPRPSVSRIGLNLNQPLRAPRASIVPSTNSANPVALRAPTPTSTTITVATTASTKPATAVLAPSVRANSTITPRTSRPSLIGGLGGGLTKKTSVSTMAINTGKLAAVKETSPTRHTSATNTKMVARPRPRTSSAGAALISRPELEMELERDRERAMGVPRPVSVAARLLRPKSSLSRV